MSVYRFDQPFWNPWVEFERLHREMDRLLYGVPSAVSPRMGVFPALTVSEDRDALYVRAEMPGIKAEDVEISLEDGTLLLKGERRPIQPEGNVSYHRRELEYGRFSRAITLPSKIRMDKVKATTRDGILTITLPKAEEAKPRRITVDLG
ncbi:MAG: Hsp20/alpha crystallin family protein [Thermodesulfobacteriota bacterium]